MTARAEIVSLLVDMDMEASSILDRHFTHKDGQPFTDAETELAASARLEELDAAQRYLDTVLGFHQSYVEAITRLQEITRPYYEAHGGGTTLGELMPHMTATDRAAVEVLLGQRPDVLQIS